jgi:hypothetical protein
MLSSDVYYRSPTILCFATTSTYSWHSLLPQILFQMWQNVGINIRPVSLSISYISNIGFDTVTPSHLNARTVTVLTKLVHGLDTGGKESLSYHRFHLDIPVSRVTTILNGVIPTTDPPSHGECVVVCYKLLLRVLCTAQTLIEDAHKPFVGLIFPTWPTY